MPILTLVVPMSFFIHVPDYVLYEDEVILVVMKPAGLMVEPDRNGHPNLLQQVKAYLRLNVPSNETVYAQHIHRLDRPVSGIVLFAKQRSVLKNLSEQFAERKVKKYYQALTAKSPGQMTGRLEHWHRKEKKKAVLYDHPVEYAEKALLEYSIAAINQRCYCWDIALHTGKYHQIRAQLASVACPIIGDALYGSDIPYQKDSIALHACKLVFQHPLTQEEISIVSESKFLMA